MKPRSTLIALGALILVLAGVFFASREFSQPKLEPSKPEKVGLAHLENALPMVSHKRNDGQTWEESIPGVSYFEFDAVQTHASAAARIAFDAGTKMDLAENTHVIITAPPQPIESTEQRAIVKNGSLKGRTNTGLWLINSGTLFRLKPKSKDEEASVQYSLRDKHSLTITLESGKGSVFRKKEGPAGAAAPSSGNLQLASFELEVGKPSQFEVVEEPESLEWKVTDLEKAEPEKAAEPRFDFSVDLPPDNSIVNKPNLIVKGKVTQKGGRLLVNGKEVKQTESLSFESVVVLNKGANRIIIQLVQPNGKSLYRQWVFVRRK